MVTKDEIQALDYSYDGAPFGDCAGSEITQDEMSDISYSFDGSPFWSISEEDFIPIIIWIN